MDAASWSLSFNPKKILKKKTKKKQKHHLQQHPNKNNVDLGCLSFNKNKRQKKKKTNTKKWKPFTIIKINKNY